MPIISGVVVPGLGMGTTLGYPTANLQYDHVLNVPPPGVYAAFARVGEALYPAAVAVGSREQTPALVEAHLIGFSGDLVGQEITLELGEFISGMVRCSTQEDLKNKIAADVAAVKKLLEL